MPHPEMTQVKFSYDQNLILALYVVPDEKKKIDIFYQCKIASCLNRILDPGKEGVKLS